MPITLTTPINTGDLDSNNYDTVKVVEVIISPLTGRMAIITSVGYMDEGEFVPGKVGNTQFDIPSEDVTAMKAVVSQEGETWWDLSSRVAYQWLLDNEHAVGSIT